MGVRTLVVQICAGLPEMATPHPGITIPPKEFVVRYPQCHCHLSPEDRVCSGRNFEKGVIIEDVDDFAPSIQLVSPDS